MSFQEVPFTPTSKADIYSNLRAHIMDQRVELLDSKDALRDLRGLEVELLPGGAVRVRHRSGGHDDYADAMALVVREAAHSSSTSFISGARAGAWMDGVFLPAAEEWL